MIIWSIQPKAVLDIIESKGIFQCDGRKAFYLKKPFDDFRNPYQWMVQQMQAHGIQKDKRYPIWGWYKYHSSDNKRKAPRLRQLSAHCKGEFRLKLKIPDDEVLLSDFDEWHKVLCDMYVGNERYCIRIMNAEQCGDFSYEKIKQNSWNKIFNIEKSIAIQACFPIIRKDYLIQADEIT